MANIAIWPGSSSFFPGMTPLGFYDNDYQFQQDADKVANFCAQRLGYPVEDVELQDIQFYAAFEEAISTYSNEVFQYKIRENYISMEGASTGTSFNNKLISPNLQNIISIAGTYGVEAEVGGPVTLYSGSIDMIRGIQNYDLAQWAIDQNITGGIEIRKVFYEAPPAILPAVSSELHASPSAAPGIGFLQIIAFNLT